MYLVKAYGKTISFDADIPFVEKATSPYEFSFIESDLNVKEKKSYLKKKSGFFTKDSICSFLVKSNQISYSKKKDLNLIEFACSALNQPMAYALNINQNLVLHCSGVELNGEAYLFLGFSNAGKTTSALKLLEKGKLITEDIGLINFIDGVPYIQPSHKFMKVSKNFKIHYSHLFSKTFSMKYDKRDRDVCILNDKYFAKKPLPVKGCIVLNNSTSGNFKPKLMSLEESFSALTAFSISSLYFDNEIDPKYFEKQSKFLNSVQFINLNVGNENYPSSDDLIESIGKMHDG